ncbi:MAG: cyclase family protein, partial [Thermoplasmata archaeon]
PEKLVGSAAVLDLRGEAKGDTIPARALSKHWPSGPAPEVVLLETGWSEIRAPTRTYLYDFPGIDPEGATWLAEKGIRAVGTDALGIDPYSNSKFEAHKVLLGKGIYLIEAMAHLSELTEGQRYTLFVGPLNIAGASGAMARVLAVE